MNALLLAGGKGTRLSPITDKIPKCLIEIAGRPLLDFWLEKLCSDQMFERVYINTHHLHETVEEYIRNSLYSKKVTLVYEPVLRGTGGTLLDLVPRLNNDQLFFAHADNLSIFDMEKFRLAFYQRPAQCLGTIMCFEAEDPKSCGILEVDESGIMLGFHEKVESPPGNFASGAVFLVSGEFLSSLSRIEKVFRNHLVDFSSDILPLYLGKFNTWKNDIYHRDIGTFTSLERGRHDFLSLKKSL